MSPVAVSNLDEIQLVVSARFGGPEHRHSNGSLLPSERAALHTWANRLRLAEAANRQVVLPNGALVWA